MVTGNLSHYLRIQALGYGINLDNWRRNRAIVCYSTEAFGGVRAAIALPAMLGELGMSSIPSIFPIPKVQDAFREDGSPIDEGYERRIVKFLDELEWYARALKAAWERDQDRERSNCSAQQLIAS